ncbi:hypothetical protein GCM10010435_93580 [Winogradskya consettensis]|uniref:histidine kinase n=1 Tax=Winogradskya consettensis TaxID=113560 RepID=A0A919T507_9ACTN|nr:histidine kinase [Actinoplanes consettensis]GIM84547.1 hypothetical protein Aco04nite_91940 [Actinoplanes consettensis]
MERGRVWRLHRSWLIALLLCGLLLFDLPLGWDSAYDDEWWVLPCAAPLIVTAVLAPRSPVRAGLATAGLLIVSSVVVHLAGAHMPGPIAVTEVVAVAAIVVEVVRAIPALTAAALVSLLTVAEGAAELIRGGWPRRVPSLLETAVTLAVLVVVVLTPVAVGRYLRGRDSAAARATRNAVAAARYRERVGLARELHDVVAHHIGGVVVQAQAAQVMPGPEAGARLLALAEEAGTDALAALRRMVSVLREGEPDGGAPARPMDLDADLRAATATPPGGTPVRLSIAAADSIPAVIATSVLRLVQESVTNARRHAAGAREIAVTVSAGEGIVRVTIRNDGRPGAQPQRYGGGFGLVGMGERVQLLGGRFAAGPEPDGGWQVVADLPLAEPAR